MGSDPETVESSSSLTPISLTSFPMLYYYLRLLSHWSLRSGFEITFCKKHLFVPCIRHLSLPPSTFFFHYFYVTLTNNVINLNGIIVLDQHNVFESTRNTSSINEL
jgi:hypothetical protein